MNDWNTEDLVAANPPPQKLRRGLGCSEILPRPRHENVMPEIMILAKALTNRYVSLTITLLTEQIFSALSERSNEDETAVCGDEESV
jgi:hypothetical protein